MEFTLNGLLANLSQFPKAGELVRSAECSNIIPVLWGLQETEWKTDGPAWGVEDKVY